MMAALAVALAACSGSEDATTTVPPTDDASTTDPPTTTDAPTTTPPPTTDAPTTTVDPATAFADEVEADFLETMRLTDEAFMDPTNDDKVAAALAGFVGGNLDYIRGLLEEFRTNGWVARPNPDVLDSIVIEARAQPNGVRPDSAVLQVCDVNAWIVVEPGAGPNGSDAIVDPDVVAFRSRYALERIDGRWLILGSAPLGSWNGVAACPDE